MSLDKHDVVPIDTHVYQIAVRDYKFKGNKSMKTLNKETYAAIRLFSKTSLVICRLGSISFVCCRFG